MRRFLARVVFVCAALWDDAPAPKKPKFQLTIQTKFKPKSKQNSNQNPNKIQIQNSKNSTKQQCIELDFQYPSEGIHRRWDAGFRITACAATPDQSAFALSVPRRRPMDETQETLRTSAFPSSHVKEKWAKNLYIAGIAYGRTVS